MRAIFEDKKNANANSAYAAITLETYYCALEIMFDFIKQKCP